MKVLALHGLPTSPRLWERLQLPPGWQLETPPIPGLGPEGTAADWNLRSTADLVGPLNSGDKILVGHDIGGVLAAMIAIPGQTVILSGTALGMYWAAIRLIARDPLQRYFFERHQGRRFISHGSLPEHRASLLEAFSEHGPDWGARMRLIARGMKPPMMLALGLRSCAVRLAWGRHDPWYPSWIAQTLKRTCGAKLFWLESGHFAPWEDPRGFADVVTGAALIAPSRVRQT